MATATSSKVKRRRIVVVRRDTVGVIERRTIVAVEMS